MSSTNKDSSSFENILDIVKRNDQSNFDLVYKALLLKPEYLTYMPDNETYTILHYIVLHGALEFFNKVIAIPNIRFLLLTKTATRPPTDILQIANENRAKSKDHQALYNRIERLIQMDKLVDHGKSERIDECRRMLLQNEDLANEKPPYRKYYLIHHLAFANKKEDFDKLWSLCAFNLKLLTSDQQTASEVAFEQNHRQFAEYLESLCPEMRAIRERHEADRQKQQKQEADRQKQQKQEDAKYDDHLEKQLIEKGGPNMLDCFTCPLTKEVFRDPVVLSDGFTYERSAIQEWLAKGNPKSPMTNVPLTSTELVPNMVIKQALNEMTEKQRRRP